MRTEEMNLQSLDVDPIEGPRSLSSAISVASSQLSGCMASRLLKGRKYKGLALHYYVSDYAVQVVHINWSHDVPQISFLA